MSVESGVDRSNMVGSLANGLAVLTSFDSSQPTLTISEAAVRTGLTRASARRVLLTLSELGFVSKNGNAFSLTPRALSIGHSYLNSSGLGDTISRHIALLANEIHESISAAVLDGSDIVYIARSAAAKIMQVRISIGTRFPAVTTSMGRVMLADLRDQDLDRYVRGQIIKRFTERTLTEPAEVIDEIRRVRTQGYALVNQELEVGLKSIAVPIHGTTGRVVAAINIAGLANTESNLFDENVLNALLSCARAIERDLADA